MKDHLIQLGLFLLYISVLYSFIKTKDLSDMDLVSLGIVLVGLFYYIVKNKGERL